MKIKTLLACLLTAAFSGQTFASDDFTVYLTRHAEKQSGGKDPALTQCGHFRAQQLATMLKDTNIKQVYSTSYQRTLSTAQPFSDQSQIAIKQYAPNHLAQLAHKLKQDKQNTLVVGHSNTTPELVKHLSQQTVADIDESEYQLLYQIHFVNDKAKVTLLRQATVCR